MTPEQIFLLCRIPSLPCSFPGTMVSLFSGTVPTGTHSCWKFSCLLNVFCSWCHVPLCSHPVLCSSFYQTPGKGGLRSLSAFICCSLRKLPQTNVCPHCDTKTALAKARANQGPFFFDLNLSAALALAGPSHLLTAFLYPVSWIPHSPPLSFLPNLPCPEFFFLLIFLSFRLLSAQVAPGSFYINFTFIP